MIKIWPSGPVLLYQKHAVDVGENPLGPADGLVFTQDAIHRNLGGCLQIIQTEVERRGGLILGMREMDGR
jgi:hypothetical protein